MGAKSVLEKVVTREPQYTMLLANLMATNPDVCECVIQCLAGQYAFPKHTKAKILCESPFKLLPIRLLRNRLRTKADSTL